MKLSIPGYEIDHLIAEGGMATVYLATQKSLDRPVALKLLNKFDHPSQSERFLYEGRIIASLNHRNVINIYDIGLTDDDRPYISMEYLEGGDLETRIKRGISKDDALQWLEAIGDCLGFVHRKGIIHRDIKPGNILFHKDGTPILSDFGVATQETHDIKWTMDGLTFGSPCYISPEQATCGTLDGRTDIYGLGIVLYEMLTGCKPYVGNSHIETIAAHLSEPPPALPSALRCYQPLIQKMMAKSPDDRFGDADEMLRYVQQLRQSETPALTNVLHNGLIESLSNIELERKIRKQLHKLATAFYSIPWVSPRYLGILLGTFMLAFTLSAALLLLSEKDKKTQGEELAVSGYSIDDITTMPAPPNTIDNRVSTLKKRVIDTPALSSENHPFDNTNPSIESLLSQAGKALQDYQLTTPENDNAYAYYLRVLELDPNSREAIEGINNIVDTYADFVEKKLDQFDYDAANKYLNRGLAIQPNNQRLKELQSSTNVLKDAPKRALGKIKSLFN